jgi:glucosyltransferase
MDTISIIVPCYNEEESLPHFYDKITSVLAGMKDVNYELLFINDGSKDRTLSILRGFAKSNKNSKYISFSRNFGKEAAMLAGLQGAIGDYVAILDADLQHPPELLPEMYRSLKNEDIDCACAMREDRDGEKKVRSFLSRQFYKIINKFSEIEMIDGAGDYRMMSRQMVDSILRMREYNRYAKGLFAFVGFEIKFIPFHNVKREAGTTKWTFYSLLKYAINGMFSFSTAPLVVASLSGILFCIISIIMAIYCAAATLIFGNPTDGWTTLVVLLLFIGGLQMLFLGIAGQYISKIYLETKQRPIYIIKETNLGMEAMKKREPVDGISELNR